MALLGCPRLRDVDASIRILRHLGCDAHWEADALAVDTTALRRCEISDVLMREMRSSAIFLGAILARCGQADLSYPGGCELGPRPIDLHLAGLRDLGAEIREEGGFLHCRADRLRGREVVLRMPSVGATENLMLAACGAEGVTVISNAAREPEVVDLQNFLNACGARVSGAGSSAVSIEGGQDLHGCTYRVMPDRIAAATYLCAAASAGGDIYLRGAEEGHLSTVTAALREAGCTVTADSGGIRALCRERLRAVGPVQTAPYPGFPTDAQAVLMAALLRSRGATVFEENIFENRYRHVDELIRMGASIRVSGPGGGGHGCGAASQRASAVYGSAGRGGPVRGGSGGGGGDPCLPDLPHRPGLRRPGPGPAGSGGGRGARGRDRKRVGETTWPDADIPTGGAGGETSASSISCCPCW